MIATITIGLLAWVAVGFVIVLICSNVKSIQQSSIKYWKVKHWFLAIVVWPWFLAELAYAAYLGWL